LISNFTSEKLKARFGTDKGKKVKGKGLGTCYSAAYETRTAALYNLGSGS